MRYDPDDREYAYLDITADDVPGGPTGAQLLDTATLEVRVGTGDWETWDWNGEATATSGNATRTARRLLAGRDADPGDDTALVLSQTGTYKVRWRLVGVAPEQPSGEGDAVTAR